MLTSSTDGAAQPRMTSSSSLGRELLAREQRAARLRGEIAWPRTDRGGFST